MTAIKLPVRKEMDSEDCGANTYQVWVVRDADDWAIATCRDESHADAIVSAVNGEAKVREMVRSFFKRFDSDYLLDQEPSQ